MLPIFRTTATRTVLRTVPRTAAARPFLPTLPAARAPALVFSLRLRHRSTDAQAHSLPPPQQGAPQDETEPGETSRGASVPTDGTRTPVGEVEPRLQLTFTCIVPECGHRSTHEFAKKSYTNGIVLVECPGCKNRHLIADNLGWFKDSTEEGKLRTVEDLMRAKGEKVRRGRVGQGGDLEYYED